MRTSSDRRTAAQVEAHARVAGRSTRQLCEMLDMTLSPAYIVRQSRGERELPMLRGWILDELEARHPVTFAAWLDAEAVTTAVEAFGHLWGDVKA